MLEAMIAFGHSIDKWQHKVYYSAKVCSSEPDGCTGHVCAGHLQPSLKRSTISRLHPSLRHLAVAFLTWFYERIRGWTQGCSPWQMIEGCGNRQMRCTIINLGS
eukprot:1148945-Pelagomonas_calceolata.AAC.2